MTKVARSKKTYKKIGIAKLFSRKTERNGLPKRSHIGVVTHYFNGIKIAIVKPKKILKKGDKLLFEGSTTNFMQKISSMQYNHKDVSVAKRGQQVGIKIKKRARTGDKIYGV